MRTLSIWAALVFAVATFGEEPSLTLHVVKVTNREDGYAVEAKSKNIYYYLSCGQGTGCLRFHAGKDYVGKILAVANFHGRNVEQFLPIDAPKISSQMGDKPIEYSVGYTIDAEAEIEPCGKVQR